MHTSYDPPGDATGVRRALGAGGGQHGGGSQRVFTVDLDADSYDLLARAARTRIECGLYTPNTERTWQVLRDASQQGLPWASFDGT